MKKHALAELEGKMITAAVALHKWLDFIKLLVATWLQMMGR
jgi:hypothetical protein